VGCKEDNNEENEVEVWKVENERFFNNLQNRSDLHKIEAESGNGYIYYKILRSGNPSLKSPKYTSDIYVYYTGATLDGFDIAMDTIIRDKCFDTSYKGSNIIAPGPVYKPARFEKMGSLIEGWWIALQEMVPEDKEQMQPGDKWQLYIPQELGYKASKVGSGIPAYSTLIFEVELVSFIDK